MEVSSSHQHSHDDDDEEERISYNDSSSYILEIEEDSSNDDDSSPSSCSSLVLCFESSLRSFDSSGRCIHNTGASISSVSMSGADNSTCVYEEDEIIEEEEVVGRMVSSDHSSDFTYESFYSSGCESQSAVWRECDSTCASLEEKEEVEVSSMDPTGPCMNPFKPTALESPSNHRPKAISSRGRRRKRRATITALGEFFHEQSESEACDELSQTRRGEPLEDISAKAVGEKHPHRRRRRSRDSRGSRKGRRRRGIKKSRSLERNVIKDMNLYRQILYDTNRKRLEKALKRSEAKVAVCLERMSFTNTIPTSSSVDFSLEEDYGKDKNHFEQPINSMVHILNRIELRHNIDAWSGLRRKWGFESSRNELLKLKFESHTTLIPSTLDDPSGHTGSDNHGLSVDPEFSDLEEFDATQTTIDNLLGNVEDTMSSLVEDPDGDMSDNDDDDADDDDDDSFTNEMSLLSSAEKELQQEMKGVSLESISRCFHDSNGKGEESLFLQDEDPLGIPEEQNSTERSSFPSLLEETQSQFAYIHGDKSCDGGKSHDGSPMFERFVHSKQDYTLASLSSSLGNKLTSLEQTVNQVMDEIEEINLSAANKLSSKANGYLKSFKETLHEGRNNISLPFRHEGNDSPKESWKAWASKPRSFFG